MENTGESLLPENIPTKDELESQAYLLKSIFIGKKMMAKRESAAAEHAFDEQVGNFAGEMRKKYPNTFDKAVLFHVIAGSTIGDRSVTSVDLPGGEIANFVQNTL